MYVFFPPHFIIRLVCLKSQRSSWKHCEGNLLSSLHYCILYDSICFARAIWCVSPQRGQLLVNLYQCVTVFEAAVGRKASGGIETASVNWPSLGGTVCNQMASHHSRARHYSGSRTSTERRSRIDVRYITRQAGVHVVELWWCMELPPPHMSCLATTQICFLELLTRPPSLKSHFYPLYPPSFPTTGWYQGLEV